MSERDGWNHLYLYDAGRGRSRTRSPRANGSSAASTASTRGQAAGLVPRRRHPSRDRTRITSIMRRVNFDGTGLIVLTEGDGTHKVDFSPDRQVPDRHVFARRHAAGHRAAPRRRTARSSASWSGPTGRPCVATGWQAPERFVAKGRDGKTDIYGVIFRPTNFDPAKKYPVIEQIYAGPQGAFVPKRFSPFYHAQALAELGLHRGADRRHGDELRSKAFHDVCWKNLADAGFPDRILWMKAAAAKRSVHGPDARRHLRRLGGRPERARGPALPRRLLQGGRRRLRLPRQPDGQDLVERAWMGWPVGPQYAAQLERDQRPQARRASCSLIVGELDRNVDPASTMQVVNALIKADKDFEFLVFPGAGHGAGQQPLRRSAGSRDFFVRHLLGVEPPDRNAGGCAMKIVVI